MEYFLCIRYIVTVSMIWHLNKRAVLLPPKLKNLQFGGYIKSGESSSEILLGWFKFSCMHLTVPLVLCHTLWLWSSIAHYDYGFRMLALHLIYKYWQELFAILFGQGCTFFHVTCFCRWVSSRENSCCSCNNDTRDFNGRPSRSSSYGCSPNMLTSVVGCISSHRCTSSIWSGTRILFFFEEIYDIVYQHMSTCPDSHCLIESTWVIVYGLGFRLSMPKWLNSLYYGNHHYEV